MKPLPIDWIKDLTFSEVEWLNIRDLALERGFEHPRARLHEWKAQRTREYSFMSGLTVANLLALRDEIRAGGWTYTHTARKRHFFSKPYATFNNPSLCGNLNLAFITTLEHDQNDETKCKACLRKYERLEIKQVFEVKNGSNRIDRG